MFLKQKSSSSSRNSATESDRASVRSEEQRVSEPSYSVKSEIEVMSVDPNDYGITKYSDLDVASHSVMIENLPTKISRRTLEKKIRSIFG